jgi:hypothetical protein
MCQWIWAVEKLAGRDVQECIGILEWAEHGADTHHETRSRRGKNKPKVVWDRNRVQVEEAIFGVGGVAAD